MNTQIQSILDKSTDDFLMVDQAKFARLLIEECAKLCEELRFTHEDVGEQAAYQRILCSSAIKENFGLISKGPITALNVK
jgi:hypothetical protein